MRNGLKLAVKGVIASALIGAVAMITPITGVYARTYHGADNWSVTFTSEKKMESNFKTSNIDDVIYGMQPGDSAVIEINIVSNYGEKVNWYMRNKVLKSLEDKSYNSITSGGAYGYRLVYVSPENKETVLFSSDRVGGESTVDGRTGLKQATSSLEDYFFLDDFSKGEKGKILLTVSLDGETQGNDYQDTLADLEMQFAVEIIPTTPNTPPDTPPTPPSNPPKTPTPPTTPTTPTSPISGKNVVKTGDESQVPVLAIIAGISGLVLLGIGIYSRRARKLELIAAADQDDEDEGGDFE